MSFHFGRMNILRQGVWLAPFWAFANCSSSACHSQFDAFSPPVSQYKRMNLLTVFSVDFHLCRFRGRFVIATAAVLHWLRLLSLKARRHCFFFSFSHAFCVLYEFSFRDTVALVCEWWTLRAEFEAVTFDCRWQTPFQPYLLRWLMWNKCEKSWNKRFWFACDEEHGMEVDSSYWAKWKYEWTVEKREILLNDAWCRSLCTTKYGAC